MRRPHEREPCRLPPTLSTASPEDVRPTHRQREKDHGTGVGQAEGRRRASWPRGCWAQPPGGHRRTGDQGWRLCRTRSWGQHPTAALDLPGACPSILARTPGPPSVVQEHCRWRLYPSLGWWTVGGVERVASPRGGGSSQRASVWPTSKDQLAHHTQSSHGRDAGILTCKPEEEEQNKMRTLASKMRTLGSKWQLADVSFFQTGWKWTLGSKWQV